MSKFNEFAVGWLRQSEKRGEFVSAALSKANPTRNKPGVTKLIVEMDDGTQAEVTNFQMYFNENKVSEKAPDVQFVFVTDN